MRRLAPAVLAAAAVALASPARAAADTGFTFGARLAYALPMGKLADGGADLSDVVDGAVPIWLDAGFRLLPGLFLGAYFQYGFGLADSAFCSAVGLATGAASSGCSAKTLHLGAQATWRLPVPGPLVPWVGAGLGWEWASTGGTLLFTTPAAISADFDVSYDGFAWLLQAGASYRVAPGFSIGPFASFGMGWYSSASLDVSALGQTASQPIDIPDKGAHEWLTFGLAGSFDL